MRLSTCNLRCTYCDTKYTWDWSQYDRERELREETVARVAEQLAGAKRLVVTGGEPLLQQESLLSLLQRIGPSVFVEVETNGTIAPIGGLRSLVRQWNVSQL